MNDVGAFITNIKNSIFFMKKLDYGDFEAFETPNIFICQSILSIDAILILS